MESRLYKFKVEPRAASARSSHPSLPRTGELATQFDPAGQPETPTSPESEKALRLRKRTQWIDRVTRAALLESLHSGLSDLGDQKGGMVSLIRSFGAKITSTKGWFEALGYIPRDDLECEKKIYDWEEGPNTRRMVVQITGKPTEDNADIGFQQQQSGTTIRKSVWLQGTARLDDATGTWAAGAEMERWNVAAAPYGHGAVNIAPEELHVLATIPATYVSSDSDTTKAITQLPNHYLA